MADFFGTNGNDSFRSYTWGFKLFETYAGDDSIWTQNGTVNVLAGLGEDFIRLEWRAVGVLLSGGGGNDTIEGGQRGDSITGGTGSDSIMGRNGNDTIHGGAANLGDAPDSLYGGFGNDLIFSGAQSGYVAGNAGNDTLRSWNGDDVLNGGKHDDQILSGQGDDVLIGSSGNDFLDGMQGRDLLHGGYGDDTLYGGAAGDRLNGVSGNDLLVGGSGKDRFVFALGYGADTIADMDAAGDPDFIILDDDLWGGGLTAQQVVDQFTTATGFDFGAGDSLTLIGVTDVQLVVDNIIIV